MYFLQCSSPKFQNSAKNLNFHIKFTIFVPHGSSVTGISIKYCISPVPFSLHCGLVSVKDVPTKIQSLKPACKFCSLKVNLAVINLDEHCRSTEEKNHWKQTKCILANKLKLKHIDFFLFLSKQLKNCHYTPEKSQTYS